MSGLRLVKVMPFFAPATRFGGVVTQAAKICQRLAARGHEVKVVTTDNGAQGVATNTWLERDGYRVYYAKTRPWHRVVPYYTPTMRAALSDALGTADLCMLNVGLTLTNRLAAGIARRHGVPYIYNPEGALCPSRLELKSARKRLFVSLVERPLLAGASACQAVTDKEVRDLQGLGVERQRIEKISNGIEPFEPGDATAFRERFKIPDGQRIVLHLGRLHVVKGLDLIVDAFADAAPANARLVLAGIDEDGTRGRLEAQVKERGLGENVTFTGHLQTDAERRDALSAADLFVLPSQSEGLPNAVLEALAAGVPCLLSEHCNVSEVETAGAGYVLPRERARFAEALTTLLGDGEILDGMRGRAAQLAARSFAIDTVVSRLEDLYRERVACGATAS